VVVARKPIAVRRSLTDNVPDPMPGTDTSHPEREISLLATIKNHALLLFGMLGIMWIVVILDQLPYLHLERHGIQPRSAVGLLGIVFAPFLHAGFNHVMVNSVPFLVLGGAILSGGARVFWKVTLFVALAGGLGVWLCAGKFTNHIGASGLIFGYLGFLLARGFFERSLPWMAVAVVALIVYGGVLIGILPRHAGVSWQGHLFGLLAGIGVARMMFPGASALLRGNTQDPA